MFKKDFELPILIHSRCFFQVLTRNIQAQIVQAISQDNTWHLASSDEGWSKAQGWHQHNPGGFKTPRDNQD